MASRSVSMSSSRRGRGRSVERLLPQAFGNFQGIDAAIPRLPPGHFVASVVQLSMMGPAQRHREFVADLATQCLHLRKFAGGGGSDGWRPHSRQGCVATNFKCALLRRRGV